MYKCTQNLHQAYNQSDKLDTIVDPKCYDIAQELNEVCKNPRAPIGITPDACWHKLWPNNSAYTTSVSKRITKLTKLEILEPQPHVIAHKLEYYVQITLRTN